MHAEAGSSLHIAVVGVTDRVGRALARLLAGADVRFRALAEDPDAVSHLLGPHAEAVAADLRHPPSVERALRGAERVFLASTDPTLLPSTITAARRAGARRVVMMSEAGDDGCAPDHRDAERALHASGLAWTLLRPTMRMQALADTLRLATRDDVIRLPAGDAKIALVDARDVATVGLHAIIEDEHEGRTWTLTGPAALGIADVAETISHAIGRVIAYAPIPAERAVEELRALSFPHPRETAELWALVRTGALAEVTDVVPRIGRIEPRTFARFAATYDWAFDEPILAASG